MEIDIGYTAIRAPFDGVIEERAVEIGDFVNVGDSAARIVDLDPVLVVGQAAERDIGKIKVGMPGTARLVTGETVAGKVRFVGSSADAKTRTFRVELEVSEPRRARSCRACRPSCTCRWRTCRRTAFRRRS